MITPLTHCPTRCYPLLSEGPEMLTIITEESTNDGANPDDSFMFQVDELDDYFQTAYEIAHTIGIHKAPMTVSTIVNSLKFFSADIRASIHILLNSAFRDTPGAVITYYTLVNVLALAAQKRLCNIDTVFKAFAKRGKPSVEKAPSMGKPKGRNVNTILTSTYKLMPKCISYRSETEISLPKSANSIHGHKKYPATRARCMKNSQSLAGLSNSKSMEKSALNKKKMIPL